MAYSSASLYVGDLPRDVTEGQIYDVFRTVGVVASIRVCREAITKQSLGYAYVNYHNTADAERAMEQLNFTPILGKPCRLMWSQRDPAKRKSGAGNIFIKNLDKSINNAILYDTFSPFGRILSCKVEVDNNGVSKGYGFVAYETQEEADKAMKVNGMSIADKIVFVGPFMPKKARGVDSAPTFTNIYVKSLPTSVTKEELEKLFAAHGTVTSCAIMQSETGESKGFGFVNFEKAEEAQAAVDKLDGDESLGGKIYVGKAQKKQDRELELRKQRAEQLQKIQGSNVYVKNLDDNIDDERLKQEFSRFGTVNSAKIMRDDKANSKGFGFVLFANPEDAARAIGEMNGVIFGSKPLYASLAQRKDVRRAQLATLHQQKANMMQMGMMNGMRVPVGPGGFFPPGGMAGVPPQRMMYPPQMMPRGPGRFVPPQQMPQAGMQQPGQAPPQGQIPQGQQNGGRMGPRGRNPRPPAAGGAVHGGAPNGKVNKQANAQGQMGNNSKNFKYTATARNQPGQETPEELEASKNLAGEQLYAIIFNKDPNLAGKITGMLLESHSLAELQHIVNTPTALDSKFAEAMEVLQAHQVSDVSATPPVSV